ncbi:hypothetical protein SLEP1_g56670 [Rubroshorea leprosula]|uniref:Secreted protein n=1 Tax=Rubroshorea leprosula TaxID=152421 RepID=A0AAV5MLD0_9ROSI|nr:hypothetical protein SLEP1_g56670 [Rubroshorea leprosula]
MEKRSFKLIFLGALLMFSWGLHTITQARNISIPCQSDEDCASPKCHCNGLNLCVCGGDSIGLFEQTISKHLEVQKKEKGCLLTKGVTVTKPEQLFTKNTGLRKVVRPCMGADACPMPKGQVTGEPKTQALVNGDHNYNGPKAAKFFVT